MAIIKSVSGGAPSISAIIKYVTKEEKTSEKLLSGIRCSAESAAENMTSTKRFYGKTSGRQYKHLVWSLSPEEAVSAEEAHKVSVELVERSDLFNGFEVLVATHVDREHVHSHLIVNSVSIENGHKYRHSKHDLKRLKDLSDQLCREHGLSVIEEKGHAKTPTTYDQYAHAILSEASKGKAESWVQFVATAIISALENATSLDEFEEYLQLEGVQIDYQDGRKNIVFSIEDEHGTKRKIRGKTLSKYYNTDFSKEAIFGYLTSQEERTSTRLRGYSERLRHFDAEIDCYHRELDLRPRPEDKKRERTRGRTR